MRKHGRTDANHAAVRKALRAIGASVQDLSAVGSGVPDLLVGYRGLNILLEVKDGAKPASAQKLTPAQMKWFLNWTGEVYIVTSPEYAVQTVQEAYVHQHTPYLGSGACGTVEG